MEGAESFALMLFKRPLATSRGKQLPVCSALGPAVGLDSISGIRGRKCLQKEREKSCLRVQRSKLSFKLKKWRDTSHLPAENHASGKPLFDGGFSSLQVKLSLWGESEVRELCSPKGEVF